MPCCEGGYGTVNADAKVDGMTQMLCFLCGEIIYGAGGVEAKKVLDRNPKLSAWWDSHMHSDFNRVVDEMRDHIKQETQAALTNEEHIPTKQDVVNFFISRAEKVHAVSRFHKELFFPYCYDTAVALPTEEGAKYGEG